jgi:hypothetical protein
MINQIVSLRQAQKKLLLKEKKEKRMLVSLFLKRFGSKNILIKSKR